MKIQLMWILAATLTLPAAAIAQDFLPAGTILPVSLNRGLNAQKAHAGQEIRAKVMQDVPGTPIHRGAEVLGHVVNVSQTADGQARLEISFDSLTTQRRTIPIKTDLRALASFVEVQEAQVPEEMASRGLNPETWTTQQIGGEQVYRGGGPVATGTMDVGEPTPYGIVGSPRVQGGEPCRGVVGGTTQSQAFWLFSTDACGVYGYPNLRIERSGRNEPEGIIVLAAERGKLKLQSGSGMLLRVKGNPETTHS